MKTVSRAWLVGILLISIACQNEEISVPLETETALKIGLAVKKKSLKANLVTKETTYPERNGHTSLVFQDEMWVIGGTNGGALSDVWHSKDGSKWEAAIKQAKFQGRFNHVSALFNNKMWVVGGRTNGYSSSALNDVWSSEDGISWTQVTSNAAFPPRSFHTLTTFNGSLWLIGGLGEDSYSDVWRSFNGKDWFLVTEDAPFGSRRGHAAVEHNGKLWVIGGRVNNYPQLIAKDVWYTTDGYTWTEATAEAEFPQRWGHTLVSDGERMWLTAGKQGFNTDLPIDPHLNDIWSSDDGLIWQEYKTPKKFSTRKNHTSIFYKDKLWTLNGLGFSPISEPPIIYISHPDIWSFDIPDF